MKIIPQTKQFKVLEIILVLFLITILFNWSFKKDEIKDHKQLRLDANLDFSQHIINEPTEIGTYKIVFIGSSVVWGHGLKPTESVPYNVDRFLRKEIKRPIKVYNLGLSGASFFEDYYFFKKSLEVIKPDLVIWGMFPSYDFRNKSLTWLDSGYWMKHPKDAVQAFSFLDYLFWQQEKDYRKDYPNVAFKDLAVQRYMLEQKVNFLGDIVTTGFFKSIEKPKVKDFKDNVHFTILKDLEDYGVKRPQEPKAPTVVRDTGEVPNILSNLSLKFLDECKAKHIKVLVYNHPVSSTQKIHNMTIYAKNKDYMENQVVKRDFMFLENAHVWDSSFFLDTAHLNAGGSKVMARVVTAYLINNQAYIGIDNEKWVEGQ